MNKPLGWTMAVITMTSYSTITPIGKGAILGGIDPTNLLVGRYMLAVGSLGALLLVFRPYRLRIDRRGLLVCGAAGMVNGITMLLYFWGLTRMSGSVAVVLVSLYPLVVLLLLLLRGERLTFTHGVRLTLGLGGIYFLIGLGGRVDGLGILMLVGSTLFYAVYMVIIQWFLEGYDAWTVTFYMLFVSLLVVLVIWVTQGGQWESPGLNGWGAMITLALVGTLVSRLALFVAINHVGSGQVALLAPLETFLSVIWTVVFLSETMTGSQWFGSALIITSLMLAIRHPRFRAYQPVKIS